MRRFLILLLAVGVGVVLGRMSEDAPSTAEASGDQGRGGAVSGNGDVNGDGAINLSDASYLLNWLFGGGPAPQPCSTSPTGLPATGQTTCYDQSGQVVDCTSDTCTGQDGFHQSGCPAEGRFTDNSDGTVTDTCTGLMWQKDTGNDGSPLMWCNALAYCENLVLAGHTDWRLPNVRELESIQDLGRFNPAIDPVFGFVAFNFYWSSTSSEVGPGGAWGVGFEDGYIIFVDKGNESVVVRAVRSEP